MFTRPFAAATLAALLGGCTSLPEPKEDTPLEDWLVGTWRSEYDDETTLVEAETSFREWTFGDDGSLRMRAGEWSAEFGVGYHGPSEQNFDAGQWSIDADQLTLEPAGREAMVLLFRVVDEGAEHESEFEVLMTPDRESTAEKWLSFLRAGARPLPEGP